MNVGVEAPQETVQFNEQQLNQLMDMGFPLDACKWALYSTKNANIDTAACWLMEHIEDPIIMQPFNPKRNETVKSSGGKENEFRNTNIVARICV